MNTSAPPENGNAHQHVQFAAYSASAELLTQTEKYRPPAEAFSCFTNRKFRRRYSVHNGR
jgi:hypothetical protein